MSRTGRKMATGALILLLATMLFVTLSQTIMVAYAQNVATVIILPSVL